MARVITGKECRPEAIQHIAKAYRELQQIDASVVAKILGFEPPSEDQLFQDSLNQGVTPTELVLGVAVALAARARDKEERRKAEARMVNAS